MVRKAMHYAGILLVGVLLAGGAIWSWGGTTAQAAAMAQLPGERQARDAHASRLQRDGRGVGLLRTMVRSTADVSGIAVAEVREGLRSGQSLAQIAEAHGSSGDAVVQAVVDQAEQRLDRAVAAGRLTRTEADALIDKLTAEVTRLVNDTTLGARVEQRLEDIQETTLIASLIRSTAQVSQIEITAVVDAVRAGQSLAQIAEAHGSSGDAVVQNTVERRSQQLDKAVQAGWLTRAEADAILDRLSERAADLVADTDLAAKLAERREQVAERHVRRALISTTSDITGLPIRIVAERLRSGESLAQIAESEGASADTLVQTAIENFRDTASRVVTETR